MVEDATVVVVMAVDVMVVVVRDRRRSNDTKSSADLTETTRTTTIRATIDRRQIPIPMEMATRPDRTGKSLPMTKMAKSKAIRRIGDCGHRSTNL